MIISLPSIYTFTFSPGSHTTRTCGIQCYRPYCPANLRLMRIQTTIPQFPKSLNNDSTWNVIQMRWLTSISRKVTVVLLIHLNNTTMLVCQNLILINIFFISIWHCLLLWLNISSLCTNYYQIILFMILLFYN